MTNVIINKGDNIDFFVIATITTQNGNILGFTSLENSFNYQNINYNIGLDFTSLANATLNSSDNTSYSIKIISNSLPNLFGSTIELGFGSQNNFTNIYSFFLGNVISTTFKPNDITLKLAPIAYNLKRGIGEYFSPNCRAEFGDSKCQINKSAFTFNGQITAVNGRLLTGSHSAKPVGYFVNGIINFANGNSFRILDDSKGILIATVPNYTINIGDNYNIVAGCNKTLKICSQSFNNVVNFRGEPFINS